jgi:hypothetical protein
VLVFACSPNQVFEGLFFQGALALEWQRHASGRHWLLLSFELGALKPGLVGERLAQVRAAFPGRPVGLVARGEALTHVVLSLLGQARVDVDFIVASSATAQLAPVLPSVPTLLVCPRSDQPVPVPSHVTRHQEAAHPFLNEALLPALVSDWLGRQRFERRPASRPAASNPAPTHER